MYGKTLGPKKRERLLTFYARLKKLKYEYGHPIKIEAELKIYAQKQDPPYSLWLAWAVIRENKNACQN